MNRFFAALPVVSMVVMAWILRLDLPLYDYWSMLSYFAKQEAAFSATITSYLAPFVDGIMVGSSMLIDAFVYATLGEYLFVHSLFCVLCVLLGLVLISRVTTEQNAAGILTEGNAKIFITVASLLLFWPANVVLFQNHWYALQYGLVYACGFGGIYLLSRESVAATITALVVWMAFKLYLPCKTTHMNLRDCLFPPNWQNGSIDHHLALC